MKWLYLTSAGLMTLVAVYLTTGIAHAFTVLDVIL